MPKANIIRFLGKLPRPRLVFGPLIAGVASLFLLGSDSLNGASGSSSLLSRTGRGNGAPIVRIELSAIGQSGTISQLAPAQFIDMAEGSARALNAQVAFSTAPNPAARPFAFSGDATNRGRAVDCLAAAQYYEAGSDWVGQRAVAQVVLNRVRHPAYPGSVCGVVFEGAGRRTGCQFTFTCDGAMARRPVPDLWRQTRAIAADALNGSVFAKVGLATHYHTDWVVPVWSGKLEKITNVDTHLFFRWPGGWGKPSIFSRVSLPTEPIIARLANLSDFHLPGAGPEDDAPASEDAEGAALAAISSSAPSGAAPLPSLAGVNLRGGQLRLAHPQGDAFGFLLPAELPGSFALLAYDVCGEREFCKIMGWTSPGDIPAGFPIAHRAQQKMAFLFIYDRKNRREIMAWNCDQFPRDEPGECLTDDVTRWDAVQQ